MSTIQHTQARVSSVGNLKCPKQSILFLVFICFIMPHVMAEPVDPESVLQVAQEFVQKTPSAKKAPQKGKTTLYSDIVYTHKMPKSGRAAFYIVNVDDAFVLVSADDVAYQVLGYCFDKSFPIAGDGTVDLPAHIQGFFDDLAGQIEAAANARSPRVPSDKWTSAQKTASRRILTDLPESVGPLLTTTWNQNQNYNVLCPEDVESPDGHAQAGCVATAMAQIVNYWNFPTQGRGMHSYNSNYGTHEVNFESSIYDFNIMPDALTAESTEEQIRNVAKLIYDCGVAVNMGYGPGESSAFDQEARAGLINFFRFSPDMSFAEKAYFSNDDWNDMIRQNLAANQPVYYSGQGKGVHAFVCDGYKADDYFHFNFGWGGLADGWYLTGAVEPSSYNFSSSQSAIVGIIPDDDGNVIIGQMQGTSSFVVDEPLEFYHLMGHNVSEGAIYENECHNTVSFIPKDEGKQLVVDIVEFNDQCITIFDGANKDTWLRDLSGSDNNDLNPIVSAQNGFTLDYSGSLNYAGFKLYVSQESNCRMVSNIVSSVEDTTVHMEWTENGSATQWQIEYGVKGFKIGDGIVINTTTNNVTIDDLKTFTDFDFYIRSIYGNNQFSPWNKVTLQVEAPYWQDIVTSQPEGYVFNETTNTVEISTAEGLAWWSKNPHYTSVMLMADIDLSAYKWYIGEVIQIDFNGNGHTIRNLFIRESSRGAAFFERAEACSIKDLKFENPIVIGSAARTAVLLGHSGTLNSVRNVCIEGGSVKGTDIVGTIAGETNNSTFTNCYVKDVICEANRTCGLFIGTGNSDILNCYAHGKFIMHWDCFNAGIMASQTDGEIRRCYSIDTKYGVVGANDGGVCIDTASVWSNNKEWMLRTPIYFDNVSCNNLLDALNNEVVSLGDSNLYTWTADDNSGLPVFGPKHIVAIPNVTGLTAKNIVDNSEIKILVSWDNNNASDWRVKVVEYGLSDNAICYSQSIQNATDTISGLEVGKTYEIFVQSRCDNNASGWGTPVVLTYDKLFWTEIVLEQPAGYIEDENGNVTITSSEGLAWLSKMSNTYMQDYAGKQIELASDLDLSEYRWEPISTIGYPYEFRGVFDGNNHIISNIYVNSFDGFGGLFANASGATIKNVILEGGSVRGKLYVGGLVGYGGGIIENCHSSVEVYAKKEGVGSLCGNTGGYVSNCSSSGNVHGTESVGGLIGHMYGGTVINCYSSSNIYINHSSSVFKWYNGGLIGYFAWSKAYNCYASGDIEICESSDYVGKVIGCPEYDPQLQFIYGKDDVNAGFERLTNYTTQFHHNNLTNTLSMPVSIEGVNHTDMLEALNAWVTWQNDHSFKTWKLDDHTGYPVLDDYYKPSCYDLMVSNATNVDDTKIRTKLSWTQTGEPNHWEVLYVASEHDRDEGVIISVDSNPCVLTDIPIGHPLDFYVRAVSNDGSFSKWSSPVRYIPDKLRWTEVVTTQPEGYIEDADGNVYISSAEGLAWLSHIINNSTDYANENIDYHEDKIVFLTADIDLSAYRWTPIGDRLHPFRYILFSGNNHIISGLYCNELSDYQGLFGVSHGNIHDLIIKQCNIWGENHVGAVVGYENHGDVFNCAVTGSVNGIYSIGGIVGLQNHNSIINTCFNGNVAQRCDISKDNTSGGEIGGICGTPWWPSIANCYVISEIADTFSYAGIITGTGGSPYLVSNCYYKSFPTSIPITANCDNPNNSSFFGEGYTWTLNTPPYVNGISYSDLVEALNAWVDANNTEKKYRHWVADTKGENGGFPVFAPCYCITYMIDGEVYKTSMVEPGIALNAEEEPTKEGYTFSGWSEMPETMPAENVVVMGSFYLFGDVNTDNDVDVVDVVDIARFVIGTPATTFMEVLADINKDGTVNLGDAVVLVNNIAGEQNFSNARRLSRYFTNDDMFSLTEQYGFLSLNLKNERNYTAFQFDLFVPEDVEVTRIMLNAERKQGHQILYNKVEDGHYRVVALSTSNNSFNRNDGELLKIVLNGVTGCDVNVRNIHFFDADGNDYMFEDIKYAITTSLTPAFSKSEGDIFDLQGRKQTELQRGINVVDNKKTLIK